MGALLEAEGIPRLSLKGNVSTAGASLCVAGSGEGGHTVRYSTGYSEFSRGVLANVVL